MVFSYSGSPEAAERLAAETGSTAVQADSADRDAVISLVRDSGPLDVLVVNAGIALFGDALEQDSDAIDRLFPINIHAPYHASVEAARRMPEGGHIIVIGSVNGDRMPVPGMAAMRSANRPCRGWRAAWRGFWPARHQVNVVQPGPIDTDANPENGPMKELMHSFMAIKRHGRPEEVAEWWRGWPVRRHRLSLAPCTPSTERLAPDTLGGDARFAPPPRERHRLSGIIRPGYRPP